MMLPVAATPQLVFGRVIHVRSVGLAFSIWLALGMTWLPPSEDWFGNLYDFLHYDLFSSNILGSAHYNRFPLNTLYLYAAITLLDEHIWLAHLLMWGWVVVFLWTWGRPLQRLSGDRAYAILAAAILLGHRSFFRTLTDLSCTHYLGGLLCVALALNVVLRGDPTWKAVLYCCVGTLFSEVTLLCVPTLVALHSGRQRRFLTGQSLWFASPLILYLGLRGIAYATGGTAAARWQAYTFDAMAVPGNLAELFGILQPRTLRCGTWPSSGSALASRFWESASSGASGGTPGSPAALVDARRLPQHLAPVRRPGPAESQRGLPRRRRPVDASADRIVRYRGM
jgi:hypothetical protein